MDRLAAEVEAERTRAREYKEMYDNELQNKKELTDYYEKKLHALLRDKDLLAKQYDEKVKGLAQKMWKEREADSATSLPQQIRHSAQELPAPHSDRSLKKYPPSPPKANHFKPAFSGPKANSSNSIDDSALRTLRTACPTQSSPSASASRRCRSASSSCGTSRRSNASRNCRTRPRTGSSSCCESKSAAK